MTHSARPEEKLVNNSVPHRSTRPMLTAEQCRLLSRYPLLFRATQNPGAYPSNIAHFGIQCGRGWYPIIEAAAREIEYELRTMWCDQAQNPESLSTMDEGLLSGRVAYPVLPFCTDISQVAGTLTIELQDGYLCDIDAWGRIRKAVEKAASNARYVCESCGKPGAFREVYWRHVYCDGCIAPFYFDMSS
ncbi:hypothetical protein PSP20601_00242 [Pandoraea sputorum]|uniref:Uncharacterized protein n=1 Tax=Pandoraea sputorum TaxID=93222 RepID=A0A239S918_9BURK|nr:Uncharacterised protein [Pandoraea sputorum]VVD63946.1 hypothetical protein PSP20601_00242 [Pandoraea sputorum]